MSKPVTDRALVAAWPGSGLPKTIQSRSAHGAKTTTATTPATPMSRNRAARSRPPARHATMAQARPIQSASLRVSAARPMRTPRPRSRGSAGRAPRGSRAIRVISRQAPSASAANGIVESGSAECRMSGR